MTLQAVLFDMGGTIETYGFTEELRLEATRDLNIMLAKAGIELGLSDKKLMDVVTRGIKRYHDHSLENLIEYPPYKVWHEFVFEGYSIDPEKLNGIAEDLAVFIEDRYYFREMRPEVPQVLDAIRKMGLKMGVISNVNSRGQVSANLERYGIRSYFDPIVLSSDYGIRKPDPSIFHYAARLMNVPTSACVYVGDRISRDIIGSKKAGFKCSIQIQHDFAHGESDDGAIPDAVINDMNEILPILERELSQPRAVPASRVRAFLFDAGDVLYYRPKQKSAFPTFLNEIGIHDVEAHRAEKEKLTRQAFKGEIALDEFYPAYLRLLGISDPVWIERGKTILEAENSDVRYFSGVRETLLKLKEQGYLLAIITDTANSLQTKLKWFEKGGFVDVWDSIISSNEVGMQKPDSGMYFAALTQLGVQPEQAAFVGHDKVELAGAAAIGLNTIAFNYDEGAVADLYLKSFNDLLTAPAFFGLDPA